MSGAPGPSSHPQRSGAAVAAASTFGVGETRAVEGGVEVAVARRAAAVDADGAMPAGVLGVAVDHALGGAIGRVLEDDEVMITSHMHLELVRPLDPGVEAVLAHGEVAAKGGGHAFTRGSIRSAGGELLALISARFAMLPISASAGGVVRPDEVARTAPAEAAEADQADGGAVPPSSPVLDLLGLRVVDRSPERLRATVRAHGGLANERRGVHGGVGVLVGERVLDLLVRSLDGGAPFRPVELRALFLRPLAADGSELACDAEVAYAGRSVVASRATLRTPAGKPAVVVDAVHALDR